MNRVTGEILSKEHEILEQFNAEIESAWLKIEEKQKYIGSLVVMCNQLLTEINALLSAQNCNFALGKSKIRKLDITVKNLADQREVHNDLFKDFLFIRLERADYFESSSMLLINGLLAAIDFHETALKRHRDKINKYGNGPKMRSQKSSDKWDEAMKYFLEEIPRQKNLNSARIVAAKKAGIDAKIRRLIEKLPYKK